jgi:hypothetical protein
MVLTVRAGRYQTLEVYQCRASPDGAPMVIRLAGLKFGSTTAKNADQAPDGGKPSERVALDIALVP